MQTETKGGPDSFRQWARRVLSAAVPSSLFLTRGSPSSGAVCLTFDDGPHRDYTPPVLDALRAHGIRATFFVVGEAAARNPMLVRRMVDEGHEVANHSYSHPDPEQVSADYLDEEAQRTDRVLAAITGRVPSAFRPPRGKITGKGLLKLWARRKTAALWSVDPRDWEVPSENELRNRLRATPLQPGDVVLLHDIHAFGTAAVNEVVEGAKRRGLRFLTVTQMARGDAG